VNGQNGTNYPYPIVSTLTWVSNSSATYIQVNMVNASTPGMMTLNIQPHASYSAAWTTLNQINLYDRSLSTGNTYSVITSCLGTVNAHCYINGGPTNWAITFNGITAFQRSETFTLTVIGSDSTGLTFQSVYTVSF